MLIQMQVIVNRKPLNFTFNIIHWTGYIKYSIRQNLAPKDSGAEIVSIMWQIVNLAFIVFHFTLY